LLRVLVAHKSFNPGGQAPGASDFFSSLSGPTAAGMPTDNGPLTTDN
jgi:hypothetical protein